MKRIFFSLILFYICTGYDSRSNVSENGVKNNLLKEDVISFPHIADTATRYIYLTFDDGPLGGSEDIDDAVTKEKIKINVFIVGQHALSSRRMKRYFQLYVNNPLI